MTYKNVPKGHSFSGGNVTHNSRGRASYEGRVRPSGTCWRCKKPLVLKITTHGEYCSNCGVPIVEGTRVRVGQMSIKDYRTI